MGNDITNCILNDGMTFLTRWKLSAAGWGSGWVVVVVVVGGGGVASRQWLEFLDAGSVY